MSSFTLVTLLAFIAKLVEGQNELTVNNIAKLSIGDLDSDAKSGAMPQATGYEARMIDRAHGLWNAQSLDRTPLGKSLEAEDECRSRLQSAYIKAANTRDDAERKAERVQNLARKIEEHVAQYHHDEEMRMASAQDRGCISILIRTVADVTSAKEQAAMKAADTAAAAREVAAVAKELSSKGRASYNMGTGTADIACWQVGAANAHKAAALNAKNIAEVAAKEAQAAVEAALYELLSVAPHTEKFTPSGFLSFADESHGELQDASGDASWTMHVQDASSELTGPPGITASDGFPGSPAGFPGSPGLPTDGPDRGLPRVAPPGPSPYTWRRG
eukprot:gnl/TRDRNA2_/TRDRNA2_129201_c0_seq1.p1 gnl/TRDRNA2_/TRDRNA2_129201_c0~~gnl/TRDRNA2_/TRDRNA2_129201_c0_seq1.p1  ORF type:complete len:331 (+),score=63.44 gnl/TRDRNA2_/TRDRNA2_129201_c0_seq1:118-1110(+)